VSHLILLSVQVSEVKVTTVLMGVRYILIFVFLFSSFDFKNVALVNRLYFLFVFLQQFKVAFGSFNSIWIPGM
jgi:hypothetical protein